MGQITRHGHAAITIAVQPTCGLGAAVGLVEVVVGVAERSCKFDRAVNRLAVRHGRTTAAADLAIAIQVAQVQEADLGSLLGHMRLSVC